MGSLTCAQIWVRSVHTKGGQAQTRLHKSGLGGTEKRLLTLQPHHGLQISIPTLKPLSYVPRIDLDLTTFIHPVFVLVMVVRYFQFHDSVSVPYIHRNRNDFEGTEWIVE